MIAFHRTCTRMARPSLIAMFVSCFLLNVSALAQTQARKTIRYGSQPTSFGELQVPDGTGPYAVAVLIHGGCWRSDRGSTVSFRALADALEDAGIASWNIEYRRVGHDGGGWPGTFRDLADAVDMLPKLAHEHPLDLDRIFLVGHSSGGHFAAWLATRKVLPVTSEIRGEPAIDIAGVVLADAYIDPLVIDSTGVNGSLYCDDPLLERLIGGSPDDHADRLREFSPMAWLPWGLPQEYIVSSRRYPVTPHRPLADGRTTMKMLDYPALARAAGDDINVEIVDDADHFDFVKGGTAAWEAVRRAVIRSVERRK